MYLLLFNLSLLEIIILPAGALILGCTIYFVYTTRKSLRQMLDTYNGPHRQPLPKKERRRMFAKPAPQPLPQPQLQPRTAAASIKKASVSWPEPLEVAEPLGMSSVAQLKETLHLQQQTLAALMQKVEDLQGDAEGTQACKDENEELLGRIEELELALMRKDAELKTARQQEGVAQQMAARIDEVYKEFELLQNKIASLEGQASRSGSLGLELEDVKQAYAQLHKEAQRKQEKWEEALAENRRLRSELSVLEDKLAEANTQRQQLMKRTKFLQDTQIESQSVTESQGKLQKELRRIGELESMLNLMAEERDRAKGLGKK